MTTDEIEREAAALTGSAGVRILDDLAVIDVAGDDSRSWLNGQLTNDVRGTTAGDAVYALAVSVKGRIMADAWVLDRGQDAFFLLVPRGTCERLLESFDAQIIMEDVEVRVRDELAVVTVQGPRSAAVVATAGDAAVPAWPCDRLGVGGRDVVVERAGVSAALEAFVEAAAGEGGMRVSEPGWELARLRLSVPRFGRDFDERTYPQEAGLEARAVSFQKGCYLGQEVVCMLENRGQIKRRLVSLSMPARATSAPDAVLVADGKDVGRLTSLALDPKGGVVRGARLRQARVRRARHGARRRGRSGRGRRGRPVTPAVRLTARATSRRRRRSPDR